MGYSPTSPPPLNSPQLHVIRSEDDVPYDTEFRANRATGFTVIPAIVKDMNDGYAVAVFEAIARHANASGECWPSVALICAHTGWSKTIVLPAIKRLGDVGAILKIKRQLHGMDQANLYRITAYEQVSRTETPVSRSVTLGVTERDLGCHAQRHELEPVELKPKEQERVKPPTPKPDDRFELDFWRAYPKGRGSKQDAARLWSKLSDEDRAAAVAALPLFAAGRDWKRGFHTAPEVWIRGRRWENPPPPDVGEVNGHSNGKPRGMTTAELLAYGRGEYEREQGRDDTDFIDVRGSLVK